MSGGKLTDVDPRRDAPALQAIDLSKRYRGGALALSQISLEVQPGSTTALVGPNAAGKSTLIKTWMAFERPTRGSVRVRGIDPWRGRSDALRHLGYVPQQPALYRALTVEDHLDYAAHERRDFERTAARDHLRQLDIPLGAKPTRLSGGQQAQVMLAIALATHADVLLLDEPLASLDPLARSEFLAVLTSAVRRSGSTALFSSHIVTDIEQACDHLIVLGIGRVLLDTSLSDALATHRVLTDGVAPTDSLVEVGRLTTDKGVLWRLVRNAVGGGPNGAGQTSASEGRPATLDEIVKGHLVAGRRLHAKPTGR